MAGGASGGNGAITVNRANLQQLAEARIAEAKILLDHGGYSGAYYLAGYAVECGLKSCILAYVERTGQIFEDKKYAEKCWTHDLEALMKLAGLEPERVSDAAINSAFGQNWQVVKDWKESSRYRLVTHGEAERLYRAITDQGDGVLPWIRMRW